MGDRFTYREIIIKMRILALFVSILFVSAGVHGQTCRKYYKEKLEPNSKIIRCKSNYTVEQISTGEFIYKRYYPSTKQLTHLVTYRDKKLHVKHGQYQHNWDDGTVVERGKYVNNKKEGLWLWNTFETGEFKNDKKFGLWKSINSDSILTKENNYLDGQLHGKQIEYDSLGAVILEEIYDYGKLISSEGTKVEEVNPTFQGCEGGNLSEEGLKKCSDQKFLQYIYKNLKYPRKARAKGVQGRAIIRFVVDKDGKTKELKVLNGVSKEIQNAALEVIKTLPRWNPGTQNGKPVRVLYYLPIEFKLI